MQPAGGAAGGAASCRRQAAWTRARFSSNPKSLRQPLLTWPFAVQGLGRAWGFFGVSIHDVRPGLVQSGAQQGNSSGTRHKNDPGLMPQLEPAADLFVTWANRSCALQAMVRLHSFLLFTPGLADVVRAQFLGTLQDTQQLQLCILDKQCEVASLAQEVQERRCHSAMLKLRLVSCEETISDLQANSVQLFKRFKDACISHQRSQVPSFI